MQNSSWKKEKQLLEEAYDSLYETSYKPNAEDALKEGEYICPETGNIMKDGKVVHVINKGRESADTVSSEASETVELAMADRPVDPSAEEQPEPGEQPDPLANDYRISENEHVQLFIKEILKYSKEDLEAKADAGELSEWINLLKSEMDVIQKKIED